jgi:hypothetical protein
MSKQRPPRIIVEALRRCRRPAEVVIGKKHWKVFVDGEMVGVVSRGSLGGHGGYSGTCGNVIRAIEKADSDGSKS